MCEQLDWKPYRWQPVACELRKLTGNRKSYRWVDGHRRRVYRIPFRGPDWLDTPGGLSGARFLSGILSPIPPRPCGCSAFPRARMGTDMDNPPYSQKS